MTHPDDLFADYVNDALDARARAEVDAHLGSCDRCRIELHSARAARSALAAVSDAAVPPGLRGEILDAVRREPRPTPISAARSSRRSPIAWLAAVGAAAAIVIGVFVYNGLSGTSTPSAGFASVDKGVSAPHAAEGTTAPTSGSIVQQLDTNYDAAGIERLAVTAANGSVPVSGAAAAGLQDAATVTACLTKGAALTGAEQPIQLIEAKFAGTPADIGIYRLAGTGGGRDRVVVWVVARKACSVLNFSQHLIGT